MSADVKAARDLLSFYVEAGVDTVLGEEPVDRFADTEAIPPPARGKSADEVRRVGVDRAAEDPTRSVLRTDHPPLAGEGRRTSKAGASSPTPVLLPPDAAAAEAREAARKAQTLDELRGILAGFDGCALKQTATQLVFADGTPGARLMLVGEAPGRDEDLEGAPFVGRSGKLLDRMLAAIGLDRRSVYIANVVPWRPPGNRTPSPQETQVCLPFIQRQIELCDPDVLVCLGGPSAETLLGQKGITKIRGRWFSYQTGTHTIRAMPTFHPAFLLRSPLQKRFAWRDFLAIKKALAG
jgi:uracil-DNA glycosylase